MILLTDLVHALQQLLTPEEFSDYCPNGLQVEGKGEVKKIAFAVSASLATLQEAVRLQADALIVHHGLFWSKDPYPLVGPKKKKIELLMQHGISLLAYHLPLDAHPHLGNNWRAALDLGFSQLEPFLLQGHKYIGVKAKMTPRQISTLKQQLETYYGHPAHVALGGKSEVSSIALVSGGAHNHIDAAIEEGVDCYVTGSFDERIWDLSHENKIHFLALGHYSTERVGVRALAQELQKKHQVPCEWIELFNPF